MWCIWDLAYGVRLVMVRKEGHQKTFTAAGGDWGDVYGYFVAHCASGAAGDLIAVETFTDGPYTVTDGLSIKITATVNIA